MYTVLLVGIVSWIMIYLYSRWTRKLDQQYDKDPTRPRSSALTILTALVIIVVIGVSITSSHIVQWGGWTLMQDFSGYNRRPQPTTINIPLSFQFAKIYAAFGEEESLCFPAKATVELEDGTYKQMNTLAIGDRIRTDAGWSEVYAFMDACPDAEVQDYLEITHGDKRSLMISKQHYISIQVEGTPYHTMITAREVQVGNLLRTREGTHRVAKIQEIYGRGIYAPLTQHGTLYVDGVLVSCYARFTDLHGSLPLLDHDLLHLFHLPLRLFPVPIGATERGRNWYSELLVQTAHQIPKPLRESMRMFQGH